MTVKKEMDGSMAVLYLDGWMDTANAPVLAQALNELDDGVKQLVFDIQKCDSGGHGCPAHDRPGQEASYRAVKPDCQYSCQLQYRDNNGNLDR